MSNEQRPKLLWSHDPWQIKDTRNNLEAECSNDGIVTVRQHELNEYDEVKMHASFVLKLANMIKGSRTGTPVSNSDV